MSKNYLKNEKIEVKPIVRQRSFFIKGHDGEFMFTGTSKGYMLPYSNTTRSYVNIFEDENEQHFFEDKLGLEKGELTVYDRNSTYWTTFVVNVTKEGKTLDLNIPSHVIEYKVLKANTKRIAPSWEQRNGNPGYEFALVSGKQVEDDYAKTAEKNEQAMELFMKLRKSNKKMYDLLRVMGLSPQKEAKDDARWLKGQINRIIEQKEKSPGVKNIDDFIAAAEDPKFSTKLFVMDAMDIGEVIIKGGNYRLSANDQLLGKNMSQVVDYFDSPGGREDKLLIEQRLELNK